MFEKCYSNKNTLEFQINSLPDIQNECHVQSRSAFIKEKWLGHVIGCLGPLIVPFLHIGLIYRLWSRYNRQIDPKTCTCSCWDTAFKGECWWIYWYVCKSMISLSKLLFYMRLCPTVVFVSVCILMYRFSSVGSYETGISSYKHVYFNATLNTYKIWIITVIAIIVFYEFGKHIFILIFRNQIRWRMAVLLVSIIYPHYYSWWSYFNYLNDDFYFQWYHQMYFTSTEVFSTISVLLLANKKRPLNVSLLLIILNVAVAHILVSGFDQLVANVVRGEGSLHQVLRDVGMFVPDIMHLTVAVYDLKGISKGSRMPTYYLVSNKHFIFSVLFISVSWVVCFVL